MEGMEDKLGAILNNPQMMQQIMSMAQSLSAAGTQETPKPEPAPKDTSPLQNPDPAMLQKLMGLAGQTGIDAQQRALLQALRPYLSNVRISKLEKAMRAAKLANLASAMLGSGALSNLLGR